jgi:hypothetical protein
MNGATRQTSFCTYFRKATGRPALPFQERYAQELPALVCVPSGPGMTEIAVVD